MIEMGRQDYVFKEIVNYVNSFKVIKEIWFMQKMNFVWDLISLKFY